MGQNDLLRFGTTLQQLERLCPALPGRDWASWGMKQWAGQLFEKATEACADVVSCTSAAGAVLAGLGDMERAHALYAKAETFCESAE